MVKEEFARMEVLLDGDVRIVVEDPSHLHDSQIRALNGVTTRCFGKDVPLQETIDHMRDAEALSLLMVKGEIRGYSLNSRLVMTRTQNPKVYSAFHKLCVESCRMLSPSFDGAVDKESLALARAFFSGCTDKQICNGGYG